jgi:hypothetical protein
MKKGSFHESLLQNFFDAIAGVAKRRVCVSAAGRDSGSEVRIIYKPNPRLSGFF